MKTYRVEVTHAPTGTVMNFEAELDEYDYDEPITDDLVWQVVLDDLEIVCKELDQ